MLGGNRGVLAVLVTEVLFMHIKLLRRYATVVGLKAVIRSGSTVRTLYTRLSRIPGAVAQGETKEQVEVHHVGQFVGTHNGERAARAPRACDAPYAVHKHLGPRGKVIVDDIIENRDVQTPRCDIGHHKCSNLPVAERLHAEIPCALLHGAVHGCTTNAKLFQNHRHVLSVVPRGAEHKDALLGRKLCGDQRQKGRRPLFRPDREELHVQFLADEKV
mmetsp:Transcript_16197/g.45741  ORF Transcript_16197/g.45741 Transcript_16197/m.45741 type:complete len:217 (-) Transcript_16197:685-1335(-)